LLIAAFADARYFTHFSLRYRHCRSAMRARGALRTPRRRAAYARARDILLLHDDMRAAILLIFSLRYFSAIFAFR